MSQEKAQLIAPQGHFTVPGLNVAGVVTASSFSGNCTGTASSIAQGTNVVVGVMTASSFAGDVFGNAAGLSTTTAGLKLGIVTATSFAGNFTGIGSGLTGTPNIVAGLVTASQFVGNTPGLAAGISAGKNLAAGIVTATTFYGDGSNLTGAGSTAFIKQDVTAVSGTTTINLNDGNIIYLTHSNNTTIAFSNVKTADDVTIIRTLTDNTITWPAAITWNGGSAPTLLGANSYSLTGQVFNLVTADGGTTWYGYEEVNNNADQPYKLFAWGNNEFGNLGQNNEVDYSSPTQIGSDVKWAYKPNNLYNNGAGGNPAPAISASFKTDGTLWAWGNNTYGQLGHNNRTQYSSPVQLSGTTWNYYASGGRNNYGIKDDGTLWAWGRTSSGALGLNQGPGNDRSSPTQVASDTTWKALGAGYYKCIATKTDGTLWGWGQNEGNLGMNNQDPHYSSPIQIGSATDWDKPLDGGQGAIKTTGELWMWGSMTYGQLAQNNNIGYSSPVQIPGTTWSRGVCNDFMTAAIKTDGTLWAWGRNRNGQLGQNEGPSSKYSSPVQIPGTTWSNVILDSYQGITKAIKTDGTLWVWGHNHYGELGQNSNVNYSSPVQIPGTWGGIVNMGGAPTVSASGAYKE